MWESHYKNIDVQEHCKDININLVWAKLVITKKTEQ